MVVERRGFQEKHFDALKYPARALYKNNGQLPFVPLKTKLRYRPTLRRRCVDALTVI